MASPTRSNLITYSKVFQVTWPKSICSSSVNLSTQSRMILNFNLILLPVSPKLIVTIQTINISTNHGQARPPAAKASYETEQIFTWPYNFVTQFLLSLLESSNSRNLVLCRRKTIFAETHFSCLALFLASYFTCSVF